MPGRARPRRRGEPPTKSPSRQEAAEPPRRFDWLRLAKRLPLAFLPALVVWVALAPFYNRFLTHAAESTLRLFESPDHSTLYLRDSGWMMVTRNDYGGGQGSLDEIRLADLHFNFLLWTAFAFAMPGVARAERLKRWAMGNVLLGTFHVILAVLAVEFVYATQLGDWSLEHYGPFARNSIGLTKHIADLPLKLAMPLVLWVALFGLRGSKPV